MPPVPEPAAPDPSSRQLLWYYRKNALRAWPQAAYEDEALLRPLFGRATLLINRPDDIRRVLVDNDANYERTRPTIRIIRPILGDGLFLATGETWRHQRRVSAPAFAPRAVPRFARHSAEAFAAAAGDLPGAEGWRRTACEAAPSTCCRGCNTWLSTSPAGRCSRCRWASWRRACAGCSTATAAATAGRASSISSCRCGCPTRAISAAAGSSAAGSP